MTWLTKYNPIGKYPYMCLVSSSVSPKSVLKSVAPIVLIGLYNLLQDPLNLPCRNLVHNPILSKQSPHGSIIEMGAWSLMTTLGVPNLQNM